MTSKKKDPERVGKVLSYSECLLEVVEEMKQELSDVILYMQERKRIPTKLSMRSLRKKTIELAGAAKELRTCTMQVEGKKKHCRYQPGDNTSLA